MTPRWRGVLPLAALCVTAVPAWGQRVPLSPGDRVRVTSPDSQAGRWLDGHVLQVTRIGVLLAPLAAADDSVAVPLISPLRLEVQRRSSLDLLLGTGIGAVVGGTAGALIPEGTPVWNDGRPGHVGEVVIGAIGGAMVGWAATWFLGPRRWKEIPVSSRGIAVAPLSRTPRRQAHFGRQERWVQFDPTEENFAAFFWAHRDSLQPIEGLWHLQPRATADLEIAIVRDTRYEDWVYVAILLPSRIRNHSFVDDGTVLFVARPAGQPGAYEIRNVDWPQSRPAFLQDTVLRIRLADAVEEWWKEPETLH
jgi:hypothetical protein